MGNAVHMRVLPRKPNAQGWTEIDFSSGRETKQVRSNCVAWTQIQIQNECCGEEPKTRVNILSLPTNQLFPPCSLWGLLLPSKSTSTGDWGGGAGEWTWLSNLSHRGALTSRGVTNRLLFAFKTAQAPSRLKLGLATEIRTPQEFFELLMWEL